MVKDPYDVELDAYEQELEDGLTDEILLAPMSNENQEIFDRIQARAKTQKKKKITFTSNGATFEEFKDNAKKIQLPYSQLLNALMELYNKGEITLSHKPMQ